MSKVNQEKRLEDERQVVEQLRTHAKDTVDLIAKQCHFTPQKVSRIISKLEKENRIWGYSAILEDDYFGLRHFYFLVSRTTVPLSKKEVEDVMFTRLDDIAPGTIVMENIEMVNGPSDAVFSFFAKDIGAAKRFAETFNKLYHPYVHNLTLFESIYTVRRRGIRNPNIKKNLNLPLIDDSVNIKDVREKT